MESKLPPPEGWNKTMKDLFAEIGAGVRLMVSGQEMHWAREYERSLLPDNLRFPQKGDIYELLEDMEATYMTSWAAPATGSGTGTIFKGERFILKYQPAEKPIGVYLDPIEYEALEKRLVPAEEREHELYGGFYFSFKTTELNTKFRIVPPPGGG
jgi:hypothetical protein